MQLPLVILSIAFISVFSSAGNVDNVKDIDNTIAAGVVFKVAYVFGAHGTWSDLQSNNRETSTRVFVLIRKDLDQLSDSEHGRLLKSEGTKLLDFLLSILSADSSENDPVKLAELIFKRLAEYATLSDTPKWVWDLPNENKSK